MRCLVDTHSLIWWWDRNPKLSAPAAEIMSDRSNIIYVSAVSGWEIANKVRAGKLPAMADWIQVFDTAVQADGFEHLKVDHHHAVSAGLLSRQHRDPFDRLLAAQAQIEDLVLITRDKEIADFGCKVLW